MSNKPSILFLSYLKAALGTCTDLQPPPPLVKTWRENTDSPEDSRWASRCTDAISNTRQMQWWKNNDNTNVSGWKRGVMQVGEDETRFERLWRYWPTLMCCDLPVTSCLLQTPEKVVIYNVGKWWITPFILFLTSIAVSFQQFVLQLCPTLNTCQMDFTIISERHVSKDKR